LLAQLLDRCQVGLPAVMIQIAAPRRTPSGCVIGQSGTDRVERCGSLILGHRFEGSAAWSGASEVVRGLVGICAEGEGQCYWLELRIGVSGRVQGP